MLKFYLLLMWILGSFCSISHDKTALEACADTAALDFKHDDHRSWGSRLTQGSGLNAPKANRLQEIRDGKRSARRPEESTGGLDSGLHLGWNVPTYPSSFSEEHDVATGAIDPSKGNQLTQNKGLAVTRVHLTPGKSTEDFENKRKVEKVISALSYIEYKRSGPKFTPNLKGLYKDLKHLRSKSLNLFFEVLGKEIISRLEIKPRYYEELPQVKNYNKNIQSHVIKSTVSYIEFLNSISQPSLYENAEKLAQTQRKAVKDLEAFWDRLDAKRDDSTIEENPDSPFLFSHQEEEEFKKLKDCVSFGAMNSNRISTWLFLMWLRRSFPGIHQHMRVDEDKECTSKTWLIGLLHNKIMSSKSSSALLSHISHEDCKEIPLIYNECLTFTLSQPFKISWNSQPRSKRVKV